MYRQSPSRNQRSKGIRVKNVLQICLLLAVCFWLIYQVKHSHDKKKEFEETDAKASVQSTSGDQLIKLGRKDIRTRVDEMDSKDDHDETVEEEETTGEEVEENKHDEDESEDKKVEDEEDDKAGGQDVETEDHEQEKSDAEIDREQGLVDGEEREDGEENETQETDSGEDHGQTEKESTVDDADHDADDRSAHEAREEHYKADDASSAVTHDSQIVTENENEHTENTNEHSGNDLEEKNGNNSEETYESESRKDLEVEGSEAAGEGLRSNATTSATEEDTLHNSANGSTQNDEVTEGSNDHFRSNSTTVLTLENNELPSDNSTESKPEISLGQGNATEGASAEGSGFQNVDPEQAHNSITSADGTQLDSNSTDSVETTNAAGLHSEEFSDSSKNATDSSTSEDSRIEAEEGNTTESSPEKNNEFEGEKSDSTDGTEEILETTSSDNPEEVQEDAIDVTDTSITSLEKDIRTDLDTLPEIQTEGSSSEDVAAE